MPKSRFIESAQEAEKTREKFIEELAKVMVEDDILMNKLNKTAFARVIEKWTGITLLPSTVCAIKRFLTYLKQLLSESALSLAKMTSSFQLMILLTAATDHR